MPTEEPRVEVGQFRAALHDERDGAIRERPAETAVAVERAKDRPCGERRGVEPGGERAVGLPVPWWDGPEPSKELRRAELARVLLDLGLFRALPQSPLAKVGPEAERGSGSESPPR